jgi:hypothetical protein
LTGDTSLVNHKPNTLWALDNKHARSIMAEYATIKLAATAQIIAFPSHRIVRHVRHGRAVVVSDSKLASVAADAGVVVSFPNRPA